MLERFVPSSRSAPILQTADEFLASIAASAQSLLDPSRLIKAIEQAEKAGASCDALAEARAIVKAIDEERVRVLANPVTLFILHSFFNCYSGMLLFYSSRNVHPFPHSAPVYLHLRCFGFQCPPHQRRLLAAGGPLQRFAAVPKGGR